MRKVEGGIPNHKNRQRIIAFALALAAFGSYYCQMALDFFAKKGSIDPNLNSGESTQFLKDKSVAPIVDEYTFDTLLTSDEFKAKTNFSLGESYNFYIVSEKGTSLLATLTYMGYRPTNIVVDEDYLYLPITKNQKGFDINKGTHTFVNGDSVVYYETITISNSSTILAYQETTICQSTPASDIYIPLPNDNGYYQYESCDALISTTTSATMEGNEMFDFLVNHNATAITPHGDLQLNFSFNSTPSTETYDKDKTHIITRIDK